MAPIFDIVKVPTTKFIGLFMEAKTHLKRPHIVYTLQDSSQQIKFALAGHTSRYAASVLMTNNKPFGSDDNRWYGYIPTNQVDIICYSRNASNYIKFEIEMILNDPLAALKLNGQKFANCCFCGIELTNAHSLAVGYGPVCADNWGLPWGNENGDDLGDSIAKLGL